jgi:hypothetical protein
MPVNVLNLPGLKVLDFTVAAEEKGSVHRPGVPGIHSGRFRSRLLSNPIQPSERSRIRRPSVAVICGRAEMAVGRATGFLLG